MRRKGKKSNSSISRTTLYTQKIKLCMQNFGFQKIFVYENQFAVEKNAKKILGRFQKYFEKCLSSPSKKC